MLTYPFGPIGNTLAVAAVVVLFRARLWIEAQRHRRAVRALWLLKRGAR